MLQKQQQAPLFSSPNQLNQLVNLSDFAGKQNVVLYFYPKDDTPVRPHPSCTPNTFAQETGAA
jgi:peroxiredoxin